MVSDSNVIRKWHLTRRKESRDPFSMYSTTIITGLPAKQQRDTSGLWTYYGAFTILAVLQRLFTVAEYIKYFQNSHITNTIPCVTPRNYFLCTFFFSFVLTGLAECTSFTLLYSPLKMIKEEPPISK